MRVERFSGFLHGQEAFWMTKKLAEVPHIERGRTGGAGREQWIIGLEVMIDPTIARRAAGTDPGRWRARGKHPDRERRADR